MYSAGRPRSSEDGAAYLFPGIRSASARCASISLPAGLSFAFPAAANSRPAFSGTGRSADSAQLTVLFDDDDALVGAGELLGVGAVLHAQAVAVGNADVLVDDAPVEAHP